MRRSDGPPNAAVIGVLVLLSLLLVGLLAVVIRGFHGTLGAGSSSAISEEAVVDRGRDWVRVRDSRGGLWTYVAPGAAADRTGNMRVPRRAKLRVIAQPSGRSLGIGLRATADGTPLADIRKDGWPVEAKVRILDGQGRQVDSASGALSAFGFG